MTNSDQLPAREALRLHYAKSRLPSDGGRAAEEWAPIKLGLFIVPLSNFQWRRRALPYHDLHHLVTGYPCTPAGELEIAAWEFAAGRFPNALSTLFCLPLIGLGAVASPVRSFGAFVRGRRSKTLYGTLSAEELLALPMRELRDRVLPRTAPVATIGDLARYVALVSSSWAFISFPTLILFAVFWTQWPSALIATR
jgi:hypothetical protein